MFYLVAATFGGYLYVYYIMFDWASVAAAGVSAIGSIAGIGATSNLNSRNRRFQDTQARLAYERQKELYDTRTGIGAQIRQYRDSGVNPNYMFQSGSMNASAPSVPESQTPQSFDVGSGISRGASSLAGNLLQGQLIKSQTDKNNAETNKTNLMTPVELEKLGYDSKTAKAISEYSAQNQEMELQLKNQELQLKTAQTAAQNAMANVYNWDALNKQFHFENIKPLELQQIQTSINKDLAQIGLLVAQKKLTDDEAKLAVANTYKTYMDAVSNRISANAQATSANAQMMNAETNRAEMPSRINLNFASAENQSAQGSLATTSAEGQRTDNDTKRQVQKFVIKSMQTSTELLGKENSWFNTRQVGGFVKDLGVGLGSALGGFSSAAKTVGTLGM